MDDPARRRAAVGTDIKRAGEILRSGGVIAYATDTLYGLGADVWRLDSVRRIVQIKGRESGKGLPVLLAQSEDAFQLVDEEPLLSDLASEFWPGALTIVCRAKEAVQSPVTGPGHTVGIRVPGAGITRTLIEISGSPLVGTSANLSGAAPAATATAAWKSLAGHVDYVLDGGPASGIQSTVLDISSGEPKLIRHGSVTVEEIRRLIPSVACPDFHQPPAIKG